MNREQDMNR